MRRRDFIKFVAGSATVWPLTTRAQQSKLVRIGALYMGTADAESFKKELRDGLRELGYVDGQNTAFEFRSAEGNADRLPVLAAELVRLKVDVIVALYVPLALSGHRCLRRTCPLSGVKQTYCLRSAMFAFDKADIGPHWRASHLCPDLARNI
jgi:hypothetical protein